MGIKRKWTDQDLKRAVAESFSYRQVIILLCLVPAGGNYDQIKRRILELNIDASHFTGRGWNIGLKFKPKKPQALESLLIQGSAVQSYKLKRKLIAAGMKSAACEKCGWAEMSSDGRVPVELDHINGDRTDNRIDNLRVLCPNCHSLQITHRGMNKRARVVEWYTRRS